MTLTVRPKFVVADREVSKELGVPFIVILSDFMFWTDHAEELQTWCDNNNASIVGTTLNIHDEKTLTAFCLRWS